MKYAIMSDAHANPAALCTAFADARRLKCGKFVFLGDATGYGYDVKATVDFIHDHFDIVLMGNHDSACIGLEDERATKRNPHYDIDRANRTALTEVDRRWLKSRSYRHDGPDFSCVHGNFIDPKDWCYIIDARDAWYNFQSVSADMAFCGHSHHACVWEKNASGELCLQEANPEHGIPQRPESLPIVLRPGSRYIVNCGSVGYPRYDTCSTYAIYNTDTKRVAIRRLPFDFPGYVAEMTAHGIALPPWLIQLSSSLTANRQTT